MNIKNIIDIFKECFDKYFKESKAHKQCNYLFKGRNCNSCNLSSCESKNYYVYIDNKSED